MRKISEISLRQPYLEVKLFALPNTTASFSETSVRVRNLFIPRALITMLQIPLASWPFLLPEEKRPLWTVTFFPTIEDSPVTSLADMDVSLSSGAVFYKTGATFDQVLFYRPKPTED